jgi:hypothetical protein
MDYLFSVDEMASLLNLIQHVSNIVIPVIEYIIALLVLKERNNSLKSIDLGYNSFVYNHITNLFFSQIYTDSNQLSKSC